MNKAVEKAKEMMLTKNSELPEQALKYLQYLASKMGYCGEVCMLAFTHYNQIVLGLSCNDDAYEIDNEATQWFKANNYLNTSYGMSSLTKDVIINEENA